MRSSEMRSRIEDPLRCRHAGDTLYIEIEDHGKGMEDVKKANPLFTTRPELTSGMGFFFYGSFHGSGRSKFKRPGTVKDAENNWERTERVWRVHDRLLIQKSSQKRIREARGSDCGENLRTGLSVL